MNHDFPVNQFIAQASALRRIDGVVAGVWIAVHEMSMQNTGMRPVHLRDYAMWLEPDVGVDPVWTSSMEDAIKERRRSRRGAQRCST